MASWLNDAIFYEIYPPSFFDANGDGIGDIAGMTAKLDYIRDSGFTAIWLNPWYDSPFRDGGYDITDFYSVAPRYGSNEDAKRFFEEAHRRGLRVILDMVIGHTAIEHEWFARSGELESNEYSDLYIWCPQLSYRGDRGEEDDYYVSGWSPRGSFRANFFAVQPALNYGYNQVRHDWEMPYTHPSCVRNREMVKDIMRFWMDLGCDGFRVDMAHSVVKRDPGFEKTSEFWREVRAMFEAEYPESVLVSEWFNPKVSLAAGFHIDFFGGSIFRNDNWMSLTPPTEKVVFAAKDHGDLACWVRDCRSLLAETDGVGHLGMFSGNHDVWRISWYSGLRGIAVKMALLLTMPGCPFVYYGDEIGMRYLPGLAKEGGASRTGSRTPMQWSAREPNLGFSTAEADRLYLPVDAAPDAPTVDAALRGENYLYNQVKVLAALRHAHPALQADGSLEFVHGADGRFPLAYWRSAGDERVLVVLNPTGRKLYFTPPTALKELLAGDGAALSDGKIGLAAESFGVWSA